KVISGLMSPTERAPARNVSRLVQPTSNAPATRSRSADSRRRRRGRMPSRQTNRPTAAASSATRVRAPGKLTSGPREDPERSRAPLFTVRAGPLETQPDRTQTDFVAISERDDAANQLAVEVRPVGRAAVLEEPDPAAEGEHGMVRGHELVVDHQAVVHVTT